MEVAKSALDDSDLLPPIITITIGGREREGVKGSVLRRALGVRTHLATWMRRRILILGLEEGVDFEEKRDVFRQEIKARNASGRDTIEYVLTTDAAKYVALAEGTEAGKAVRTYFIRCEQRLRETASAKADALATEMREQLAAARQGERIAKEATRKLKTDETGKDATFTKLAQTVESLAHELKSTTAKLQAVQDEAIGRLTVERDQARDIALALQDRIDADLPANAARNAQDPLEAGIEANFVTGKDDRPPKADKKPNSPKGAERPPGKPGPRTGESEDRIAALRAAGCPIVGRRTFLLWLSACHSEGAQPLATPQKALMTVNGVTAEMRRRAVEIYDALQAERRARNDEDPNVH